MTVDIRMTVGVGEASGKTGLGDRADYTKLIGPDSQISLLAFMYLLLTPS